MSIGRIQGGSADGDRAVAALQVGSVRALFLLRRCSDISISISFTPYSSPPSFIQRPYADGNSQTSRDNPHVAHRCARSPSPYILLQPYDEALTTANLPHTIPLPNEPALRGHGRSQVSTS